MEYKEWLSSIHRLNPVFLRISLKFDNNFTHDTTA